MSDINVLVVEDLTPIRQALRLLLDGSPGYACAGAYGDVESVLTDKAASAPDVVLLDIGLPGMSGIQALEPLCKRWPRTEFLMLTVNEDAAQVFEALCAGATGYLLKSTPPAALLDSIRDVHEGGAPMAASIARKVVHAFRKPALSADELTAREQEVLDRLIEGKSNKQIAEELFISLNTVATHIKQIYQKLHVRSRAEVVARATRRWG